ncbi:MULTISPECIES: hypothetical protein [Caballeronia]|uniref:Uncharacterized protein n=1 Tax=Caballeronia cordobensis TaxID=1353886 RepID=A0A158IB74_CABCO|nr:MULTISPECIES: hypothetical protein [Caballeronia]AET93427.1 hypothetical protein BYI23_C012810 [Burkholderia sp. YI23]AQH03248.1 hypothetical protein A9R05_30885 [Burkholderia sp. KK1]BAO90977.1 putative uncharacterized protein [Burkholderia sp. RPE67]BBP99464.1 hypothetical protein BSFA1_45930 [Burkholderia sp. SFA1]MCE4574082.1 hypothetical protein [Caballeronia sp. CLC5]
MNRRKARLTDARRLALTDADIAHLRVAIESSMRDDHPALPPAYWRSRLTKLLRDDNLLTTQMKQITELLDRLEAGQ